MTNIICHSILQNKILESTCAQDSCIQYAIIHDMKNIYVMLDKYTIKIIKPHRKVLKICM